MATNNRPADHQETAEWLDVLRRLKALEQKLVLVPELTADPDANSGCNIWIRTDTNLLKIRYQNGTVRTISTS